MKIATKKITLYILSFVFAICVGALAFVSMGNTKKVNADDPTVINLTLNAVGVSDHNDKAGVYGITRITALRFSDDQPSSNTGVFSGSGDGVYDWTNLEANTTYTGSGAYMFAPANVTWPSGYKNSTFNFIYFCTVNQPSLGDTLTINAGAYFTMTGTQVHPTSGTCNDKYVLASDVVLQYDGSAWFGITGSFTLSGAYSNDNTWNGCYGSLGAYLDDWGIEKEASSIGYWRPKTGTIIMTGPSSNVLASDKVDITNKVTGIKYNGTELKEISGAVIAQAFTNLVIYIPGVTNGVVTIEKNTIVGSKYAADDYCYLLAAKSAPNDDIIEWTQVDYSQVCKVTFDSDGGSAVDPIYLQSGKTISAPTAPTKDLTHIFDYWYLEDENTPFDFSTAITENITLTAKWQETIIYTVTFDTKGGSAVAPANVEQNTAATEPTDTPTRGTDIFEYWYLNDENTPYDFAAPVTENITLNAKWTVRPTVNVTFTKLNSTWNNYSYEVGGYTRYNVFEFTGGISSGHHGQGMDMSNLVANTTYTGSSISLSYLSMSLISGPNKPDSNMIIFRMNADPTLGDTIEINAGAWFIVGGTDNNKYVLTDDIVLSFNGSAWIIGEYVPPTEVEVTFSNINSYNNTLNIHTNTYFTKLAFNVGVSTGANSRSGYWENLVYTYSGSATVSFRNAGYGYTSVANGKSNDVYNYIMMETDVCPQNGDTLTISKGSWFATGGTINDKYIITDDITLTFTFFGEWIYDNMQEVEFVGVNNYGWNNTRVFSYSEENTVRTLLMFDKNLGTISNGNNHSAACNYITVNGVPLSEIAGATVDYSQGLNYILILMPESALIPTNLYPITKLEIAEGTPFENSRLPAVTLSLLGGAWVEGEFSSYDDLSDDGYTTIKDIAGTSRVDINSSTVYENVLNSGNVDFRFVLTAADLNGSLQFCLKNSTEYWGGFRFWFYSDGSKYIVEVYDATMGVNHEYHVRLGAFPVGLAANDYAAFAILITENNGVYSIVIVEDGVKIGEITDIELAGDKIGNDIRLEPTLITCTFIDYKKGDVSAPYICVDTPLVYFLTEGDDVPEIAYRLFDRTDASVSCEKIWDDGAYSEDKMNVGTYYCTIRATDGHGNVSEKKITVNVSPKEKEREEIKFTVRFNNKNATEYVLGSLIEQPADPTKESTKQKTYEFDGWYNGEEKWDFINDTVSSDVNLTAKYIEKDRLYTVTVIVGDDSYKMHVKYGAQPDLSMFDKSDYVAVYTVDGKEVDMISVTSDMTVNVAYVKNKSGCGSNVNPSYIAIPALMAAAITLVLRKKEKNDEE